MASAQVSVQISAEEYYEKNKSIVDELIATAKCILTKESPIEELKNIVIQGITTSGVIKNITQGQLLLGPTHDWAGKPCVPYPPFIGRGASGHFLHLNPDLLLGASDMGAVIYTSGKTALGWLLAWSVGGSTGHRNKVYVEAGPLDHLTNWDYVKAKLYASGSAHRFADNAGHIMYATVTPDGKTAQLAAIYEEY